MCACVFVIDEFCGLLHLIYRFLFISTYNVCLQNWFAFSKLHKPLFNEHGVIQFPNTNPPTDENNNAYCEVGIQSLLERKLAKVG